MNTDDNPFWVWTPEDITADKAIELFVNPFTDFFALESPSHTFINGPRGSGKSMMFRMMRADCSRIRKDNCSLVDLDYLGIYIPVKKTEISQTEMVYLDQHPARFVFNEHMLCLYFVQKVCDELSSERLNYTDVDLNKSVFSTWIQQRFIQRLQHSESIDSLSLDENDNKDKWVKDVFIKIGDYLQKHWEQVERLIRRLPLQPSILNEFNGNLLSYHGFLLPLLKSFSDLGIFPKKPVYLLIDDADNLSLIQTQILNSWIATRTTGSVCIKASTQMRYKTRLTHGGQRIEAPHDFHEIDVSVLYTSRRDHYLDRLKLIVGRRLASAGLPDDPKAFFPEDDLQEEEIAKIGDEFRRKWDAGEGRGNRPRDDANRYARPEFIRLLGGIRKSTSSYSYSGFDQLAHISSGVIRWFLEPAARMYAEQISQRNDNEPVLLIKPHIQNNKVREFSTEFFQEELEKMKVDALIYSPTGAIDAKEREQDYHKLELLISAMGRTFFAILTDETKSERRVFSIALSDKPEHSVQRILNLGVEEGFLYRSTIGTKKGHGRTSRYVLSRRLAPYFSLDPTSFSGYLFVTNDNLRQAMSNPRAFLRDVASMNDDIQMELPIES